jgi:hypothetical protein
LMDIGLEWATEKGGGVFPHHCGILQLTKVMWKVYHQERTDVRHLEMPPEKIERFDVRHPEIELRCIYEKDPVILPALQAAGRLLRDNWPTRIDPMLPTGGPGPSKASINGASSWAPRLCARRSDTPRAM